MQGHGSAHWDEGVEPWGAFGGGEGGEGELAEVEEGIQVPLLGICSLGEWNGGCFGLRGHGVLGTGIKGYRVRQCR